MAKRKKKKQDDKKEDWQKQLVSVATEMNKEMGLEPEIDIELDAEKLEEAVIENATAIDEDGEYIGVESTDEFTPQTLAVFKTLGVDIPDSNTADPVPGADEADKDKEPEKPARKTTKAKAPPNNAKKATGDHYRREYSIFDAVEKSGKPLSFGALTKSANEIYMEKGGKDNITQSEHVASICLKLLVYCGAVTQEGDKYST